MVKPFTTNRRPLVRDVSFYIFSVCFLGYSTIDGYISTAESTSLVAIYLVYVVVVIGGRVMYQRYLKSRGLPIPPHASQRLPLRRQSLLFNEDFAGRMNLHRAMTQVCAAPAERVCGHREAPYHYPTYHGGGSPQVVHSAR